MNAFTSFDTPVSWVCPEKLLTAEQARKAAFTALRAPLMDTVEAAWLDEVPLGGWLGVNRQIERGLRYSLRLLTASQRHAHFEAIWHPASCCWRLPSYWEPPRAAVDAGYPEEQLQAYRWVAALLALEVRNALEGVHSRFTSDESMPALNRGLRDAVYAELLAAPELAWKLSETTRVMVGLAAMGFPVDIPAVAG